MSDPNQAMTLYERRQALKNAAKQSKPVQETIIQQEQQIMNEEIPQDESLSKEVDDDCISSAKMSSNSEYDDFDAVKKAPLQNQEAPKPPQVIPEKPKELTQFEFNQEIRRQLGYDPDNLCTDKEGDQEGMAKIMVLKDQIAIESELDKRRTECRYRGGMVNYAIQLKKDEYDQFVKSNPHLFQKANQIIKRKKVVSKGASKKQKYDSDSEAYRNMDELDEDDDHSDDESEYGMDAPRNKRQLKQFEKRDNNSKPLDHFKNENIDQYDEDGDYHNHTSGNNLRQSYENTNDDVIRQKKERDDERKKFLNILRTRAASFEDLQTAHLKRSKIEQWVDEPFFDSTLVGAFVRVQINRKDSIVAEVKGVKDDEENMYTLTNQKKTGKYLRLLITEDRDEKLKWYKINQTSNQNISFEDFESTKHFREKFKAQKINQEMTFLKKESIQSARSYTYNKGELGNIAMTRFERALKKNDLSSISNITYFQKLKIAQKEQLEESLKLLEENRKQDKDLIEPTKKEIEKLKEDLMSIEKHLKVDLRISRFGKNELIDDIEEQENKKILQEWIEVQQKQREAEARKKLLEETPETEALVHLDEKEALFFEIKKIQQLLAQASSKSGANGSMTYYERIQKSKNDILKSHEQIGLGLLDSKQISKNAFIERVKSANHTSLAPVQANPALIKFMNEHQQKPENSVSLSQFLSRSTK